MENKKPRRFVLGDIHGMYDYLLDVLKQCEFNYEEDTLIQLGDITDRGLEPFKCMDELLKIKNLILIQGNHDANFREYIKSNRDFLGSYASNGTHTTVNAWKKLSQEEQKFYKENIFDKMISYYVSSDNIMFTHGGFDREKKLEDHHPEEFAWDRELVQKAMSCGKDQELVTMYDFKDIFIGHTPTIYWGTTLPIYRGGVTNVDTGAGKSGPLTIMDIDTKEYWQSEHNFLPHGVNQKTEKNPREEEETGDGKK